MCRPCALSVCARVFAGKVLELFALEFISCFLCPLQVSMMLHRLYTRFDALTVK
jgi:hypothetical protein